MGAVDFELGIAKVIRRVRWDYRSKQPFLEDVTKTALSARILMLPKKLQEVLQEMKREAVNDLVFTDRYGGLLKYNAVQSAFNHGFKTSLVFHSYLPSYLRNTCSYDDKKSSGCSGQPWTYRAEDDSKVCKDCRAFEFRHRRANSFCDF